MMPPPAPVMIMKPLSATRRANSCAVRYSAVPGWVRAEPKAATLRTPRYGANTLKA